MSTSNLAVTEAQVLIMASRDYLSSIVIVRSGVFGLSTALGLANRGHRDITVLDRAAPPVPDGSSVDVSRVIRWDYTDPFYASLARRAMDEWRKDQWKAYYHNTGFVLSTDYYSPTNPADFMRQKFPVWIFTGPKGFYGFPCFGEPTIKAGRDTSENSMTPEERTYL